MLNRFLVDHVGALSKKVPVLYRRRHLVLLALFCMHLFIITPYVHLTGEEQKYLEEVNTIQTKIQKIASVEKDVMATLEQMNNQAFALLEALTSSFKELTDARTRFEFRLGTPFPGNQLNPAAQFQSPAGRRDCASSRFSEAIKAAESAENPIVVYRKLITTEILKPAFIIANKRWQSDKEQLITRLGTIRKNLATDENFNTLDTLLAAIQNEIQGHRFTVPPGDWWMTVEGKKKVVDKDLTRITSNLKNALAPLVDSRKRLLQKIKEENKTLSDMRKKKQTLAKKSNDHLKAIEATLNIATIDGVLAIHYFPILLAVVLAISTAQISRCLIELNRFRIEVGSEMKSELTQWLVLMTRPSNFLHSIVFIWIGIAALHVHKLSHNTWESVLQMIIAVAVVGASARWEWITRNEAILKNVKP